MKMKSWNGGAVGVWLASNRQRIRTWVAAVVLLVLIALTGGWDYQDELNEAQRRAERAERALKDIELAGKLPRTTFVLEGKTIREIEGRLATIANDMDAERLRLKLAK